MSKRYEGSIGGECGKCGELFGLKASRFDCGSDGLRFPPEDDWDDPEGTPVEFDDIADRPMMQQYCDECDVWTTWEFDTDDYLKTGGDGWPDPVLVYWVADEFWAKAGEEDHFVVIYEEAKS
jgi:hypothetical protein